MKDNFSKQSAGYAQYRPQYPHDLFTYLRSIVSPHDAAWDCATGNGQIASGLAPFFKDVYATDISQNQLNHAKQAPNIHYSIAQAEHPPFADHSMNLITVAQAIHWFDFDAFYAEVQRILKPGGVFAIIGYGNPQIDDVIDAVFNKFYTGAIDPYWDPERKYIDEHYQTIPFPFTPIEHPLFEIQHLWTREQFMGYVRTWSAIEHFKADQGFDPSPELEAELATIWPDDTHLPVHFPMFLRVTRL
jgi:SAM-dependent methyltransferase